MIASPVPATAPPACSRRPPFGVPLGSRRTMLAAMLLCVLVAVALSAPALAATGGPISTVAGTGIGGFSTGDEGALATTANINGPRGVAWMPDGGFVFADFRNERVRRVAPDGRISTLAGTGATCANPTSPTNPCGDGGPATSAQFKFVHGVAILADGSVVIADTLDHRIRRVDAGTGIITTVAGTGEPGFSGDGELATMATINSPRAIATSGNDIYIADTDNGRVRKVSAATGVIMTVAGGGSQPPRLPGTTPVSPTDAALTAPFSVAPTSDGGLLIADAVENEIDRVSPDGASIVRVAGQGASGDFASSGDGGPATSAILSKPHSVAAEPAGGYLVAEVAPIGLTLPNNRIRYVAPDGTISTIVNASGIAGSTGDGGPAAAARVNGARGLAVQTQGRVLIAEFGGDRIRAFSLVADTPASPPADGPAGAGPTTTPPIATPTAPIAPPPAAARPGGVPPPVAARRAAPVLASVRATFDVRRAVTRVRRLTVVGIPANATVELRCGSSPAGRCPFRRAARTNATPAGRLSLSSAITGRRLRVGTIVEVRIVKKGAVGRLVRFVIRRGRTPRRTILCLNSASNRPQRC